MRRFAQEHVSVSNIVMVLTYVIVILSFTAAVVHIGIFCTFSFVVMFILSCYREYRKFNIHRAVLTILSIAVIIFFIWTFEISNFAAQLIEVLLILLGIKLLEQKKVRDYMQIYAISLLVLAALGLLIPTVLYALYILLFVVLLSLTFVFLTYYSESPELVLSRKTATAILSNGTWIPLLAIPLTIIMFLILPRSQFPFLSFLNKPDEARTGFTDTVRLGEVTNIQEDTGIIFRASCPRLREDDVYWRGMTMDYFDGVTWTSMEKRRYGVSAVDKPIVTGTPVKQTIYLEPYRNTYYFALDKPIEISARRARMFNDLTITAPSLIERRVRYEVTSVLSDSIRRKTNMDMERYLQTPQGLSPRIIFLAKSITRNGNSEEKIHRLLEYLNNGQYAYSMHGLPVAQKPLETFLFESKRGNCEYFASALALLLRISDIPSRIVGGYRGGYYNDVGNYYIVPQSNAHVWVEAFTNHRGWIRLDPTPSSPDVKRSAFIKFRVFLDTVNYFWNTVIINYNFEQQIRMGRRLMDAIDSPSISRLRRFKEISLYVVMAMVVVTVILSGIFFFIQKKRSSEMYLMLRFLRILERSGYTKKPGQGLEEFVLSIRDPQLKISSLKFVHEFEKFYYTDTRIGSSDTIRLKSILNEIGRFRKHRDTNIHS